MVACDASRPTIYQSTEWSYNGERRYVYDGTVIDVFEATERRIEKYKDKKIAYDWNKKLIRLDTDGNPKTPEVEIVTTEDDNFIYAYMSKVVPGDRVIINTSVAPDKDDGKSRLSK